ncbi:hypothetical protein BDW62DRAFT_172557 [Aspergillus aurantiobrunneus]
MADVRSLLRSELASRKGTPQTGNNTPNRVTKKRKVDPTDSLTRKRVRHTNPDQLIANAQIRPPSAQVIADEDYDFELFSEDAMKTDTPAKPDISQAQEEAFEATTTQTAEPTSIPPPETSQEPQHKNIDEDEWAAFEREVAAPTRAPQRPAAVAAPATISAAPVTTEELVALQEKEKENTKQNREAEVEGEREDAARFLEEEFDEMEQLEGRVRRLKQMREQLRMKRATEEMDEVATAGVVAPEPASNAAGAATADDKGEDEDEDEDDDDDDDWDNWRFR